MREPQRTTIGDVQYTVTPMSPIAASKLLTRLIKIVGEPMGKLASLKKQEGAKSLLDSELDGNLIGDALSALSDKLDENEMEAILKRILSPEYVTFSTDGVDFKKLTSVDGHFSEFGGMAGMFKLARFVLETNYSDFLKDLVG
jgi:hypothetical protein